MRLGIFFCFILSIEKVRGLTSESERHQAEKESRGELSEKSKEEARRLVLRFASLEQNGKIRMMHAQAICNILIALGDTESEQYQRFKNRLP